MKGCAIKPQTEMKLIWNLFLEPFRWRWTRFQPQRGGIKKGSQLSSSLCLLFFANLFKKTKTCLNPLQQHQQGPRNIHTAFFLFLSFSSSIHLTWIPLSLQGLQTNWTNHAKSRGSFKKKNKKNKYKVTKWSHPSSCILNWKSLNRGRACSWCQTDVKMGCM